MISNSEISKRAKKWYSENRNSVSDGSVLLEGEEVLVDGTITGESELADASVLPTNGATIIIKKSNKLVSPKSAHQALLNMVRYRAGSRVVENSSEDVTILVARDSNADDGSKKNCLLTRASMDNPSALVVPTNESAAFSKIDEFEVLQMNPGDERVLGSAVGTNREAYGSAYRKVFKDEDYSIAPQTSEESVTLIQGFSDDIMGDSMVEYYNSRLVQAESRDGYNVYSPSLTPIIAKCEFIRSMKSMFNAFDEFEDDEAEFQWVYNDTYGYILKTTKVFESNDLLNRINKDEHEVTYYLLTMLFADIESSLYLLPAKNSNSNNASDRYYRVAYINKNGKLTTVSTADPNLLNGYISARAFSVDHTQHPTNEGETLYQLPSTIDFRIKIPLIEPREAYYPVTWRSGYAPKIFKYVHSASVMFKPHAKLFEYKIEPIGTGLTSKLTVMYRDIDDQFPPLTPPDPALTMVYINGRAVSSGVGTDVGLVVNSANDNSFTIEYTDLTEVLKNPRSIELRQSSSVTNSGINAPFFQSLKFDDNGELSVGLHTSNIQGSTKVKDGLASIIIDLENFETDNTSDSRYEFIGSIVKSVALNISSDDYYNQEDCTVVYELKNPILLDRVRDCQLEIEFDVFNREKVIS